MLILIYLHGLLDAVSTVDLIASYISLMQLRNLHYLSHCLEGFILEKIIAFRTSETKLCCVGLFYFKTFTILDMVQE